VTNPVRILEKWFFCVNNNFMKFLPGIDLSVSNDMVFIIFLKCCFFMKSIFQADLMALTKEEQPSCAAPLDKLSLLIFQQLKRSAK
jgi:hypothetical protein